MSHFTMPHLPVVKMQGTVDQLAWGAILGALTHAYNGNSSTKRNKR
jgi:hypothetical protein